jgi:hypothetical protein
VTQLALAFDRRHTALTFVLTRPEMFRKDFAEWLEKNWQIYTAFEREALKLRQRGFQHYSARAIWHYMRHETALREGPNEHGFKLNDHYSPDAARLAMLMDSRLTDFFETRTAPTSGRIAA